MNENQPDNTHINQPIPQDQTNAKQPQEAVGQRKKNKPIHRMTKYELTRLRQKLWRENRETMEKIRNHATLCAKTKADLKDVAFRRYIIENIPLKATREQIVEIVEGHNVFVRKFKRPSASSRHRAIRPAGVDVRLCFNSFIVRAKRRGYLTFDLNEFVWVNTLLPKPE